MAHFSWFGFHALSAFAGCFWLLSGCGSDGHPPGSLVSAGGESAQAGEPSSNGGSTTQGAAGEAPQAGVGGDGGGDAGGAQIGEPIGPVATYPKLLEADVACDSPADTSFLIQNTGDSTLSVTSASADSGYVVKTMLPVDIEPGTAATLLITPAPAAAGAALGAISTATLTFRTNEADAPEHQVSIRSELFGAKLEFTDHDGVPLGSELTLSYRNQSSCPDLVKYRVHNTGNVAFTLVGPTFPDNFAGTSTGSAGQSIAPDDYVELMVGGVSAPGNVCDASGQLTFTTRGSYCGSAPSLNVVWPTAPGPTCTCSVMP